MLVVPSGVKGKTAAIVWVHSQGYFNQLSDAMLMARAGAVSLLVTPSSADSLDAGQWRDRMIATVVNIRRAMDLLAARPDVDPRRIALVGHCYGEMMGCDAVAVDKRFRAAVFEVGLLGMSIHIGTSPHPWAAGNAASEPKELKWCDTGNEVLDIAAITDRARFLARQLGLARSSPS